MVLETHGAISQSRAKTKVPIAATKRALARLGWDDLAGADLARVELGCVKPSCVRPGCELDSLEGLAAVTGRSISATAASGAGRFSMRTVRAGVACTAEEAWTSGSRAFATWGSSG